MGQVYVKGGLANEKKTNCQCVYSYVFDIWRFCFHNAAAMDVADIFQDGHRIDFNESVYFLS